MYYHNMQNNIMDCGIAVLKTVLQQYGKKFPENFTDIVTMGKEQGLSLYDLKKILELKKIYSNAYEITDYNEIFKLSFPAIAIISVSGKNHYIVIHEFNKQKGQFIISDPAATELVYMKTEVFYDKFTGFLLCIENVNKEVEYTENNDLYKEIMKKIPINDKLKYSIIVVSKWAIPVGLLLIIQYLFMYYVEKMIIFNIVVLGLFFAFISIAYFFLSLIYQDYKSKFEKRISTEMTMKYLMSEIENIEPGKSTNAVEGVFWNIVMSVSGVLQKFYLKIDGALIVIFIGTVTLISWVYTIIIAMFLLALVIYINSFKSRIKNMQIDLIGKASEVSGCVQEMTQSSLDLRLFSNIASIKKYCNSTYDRYEEVRKKIGMDDMKLDAFYDMCSYLAIGIGVSIIFLSYIVSMPFSSSKLVIAFYMSIFMVMLFKSSLQKWILYQKSVNAIEYIEIMITNSTKKETVIAPLKINSINSITLKDISVKFNEKMILNKLNFKITKGEIVGISGENGCGKTTFTKIILGLLEPDDGKIIINNLEEKSLTNSNIAEYISLYSTELFLYTNTVGNNVNFNIFHNENIDDSYSYMNEINLQYILFSNGANISQGERQKILLDRCLKNDKQIYIFDEPGTNLDKHSINKFMEKIKELRGQGKTIIIISHNPKILTCCDCEYVLKNGKLERKLVV